MRDLLQEQVEFDAGANSARVLMDLPPELRNRISRFSVLGARSAGAVTLTDDSLKRREVALIAGTDNREGLELLSPLHYLRQALEPAADLIDGNLLDILLANPDVLVLADVARVAPGEEAPLLDWVNNGGLLVRFAGPRLAASDVSRAEEDVLMPVRLRSGGRSIGGAMSWGEPKKLQPFRPGTPFYGLNVPDEVDISAQVVAQPGPDLAERTIAALSDGTPLVTRKSIGAGQVVLFHVTANAEWSSLPLSGLFVQMHERLAVSTRPAQLDATELAGTNWQAEALIDAFGAVAPNDQPVAITGDVLAQRAPGLANPPGLYSSNERRVALNAVQADELLAPAIWPAGVVIDGGEESRETGLKGALLAAAILLFAADAIASLLLTGRLRGRRAATAAIVVFCMGVFAAPPGAQAQPIEEDAAIAATSEVVLAYVVTGNPGLDDVSRAGMYGLSRKLFQRTSVEPADPVAVNLETDELAFFPFIYWPVSISQPLPSAEAYTKLNRYLRSGGMIMFDTRDADTSRFGGSSPSARRLQEIARPLDIPPLEPIPEDHVLTRTFYLLQDFPGRFASRDVWVEAAPADAEQVEGIPFRNLNDNVTPVVVGGNDWASAWATDANGMQLFPVGRGYTGERQREVAYRFGINLIMHVLTGNYKSDQVHVPALLDRLGQ